MYATQNKREVIMFQLIKSMFKSFAIPKQKEPNGIQRRLTLVNGKLVDVLTGKPVMAVRRKENEKILRLLEEWWTDESGYDEKAWPVLKKSLEENRAPYRK